MASLIFIMPWFIFTFILIYFIKMKFKSSPYLITYYFYIFYQILLSILLVILQIYRWDYGDLDSYYDIPILFIENNCIIDLNCQYPVNNTFLIAYIHSIILLVFPKTVIGIGVLGGTISALSYILLIEYTRKIFFLNKYIVFIILFLPIMHLMAGFTGKDSYSFLLSVICLISANNIIYKNNTVKNIIILLSSILLLFAIRPHQTFFYLIPIASWIVYNKFKNNIFLKKIVILYLMLVILFMYFIKIYLFPELDIRYLKDFMSTVYKGGNLNLAPYFFPLSFFQLFRPFPWEASSFIYLYIAIENSLVLLIFIFNCLSFFTINKFRFKDLSDSYKFTLFYFTFIAFSYCMIYGFSPNVGDLIRRHIYFYPFLLLSFLPPVIFKKIN